MGNTCSEATFQKQYSSFLQRAECSQIAQIEALFISLGGSKEAVLDNKKTKQFFTNLIDLIAPQYSEEKRATLIQGWSSKEELTFNDVETQIQKQFIQQFSMTITPLKSILPTGVKTTIPALLQISTPVSSNANEKSIAMVCVLDRSGSMSGSKLKFAIRAVCKVIKHLGPKDIFHLVAYDDKITVPIQNGDLTDKTTLKSQVRALRTGGSTNIADALTKAASLLSEKSVPTQYLKRIFLFSDGAANAGEVITSEGLSSLAQTISKGTDITLSTFGLGKDYNEETMSGIAKNGGGDYYFIAEATDIPVTMSKAIHGLLNLYGTNAQLLLRGRGDGIVTSVYGKYSGQNPGEAILLGDLNSNDRKKVMIDIELSCKSETDSEQVVCECQLSFDELHQSTAPEKNRVTESCSLSMLFTRDESKIATAPINNTVYISQTMQKTATLDREIVTLLDRRDYDGAISLKKKSLAILQEAQQYDIEESLPKVIARAKEVLHTLEERKDHSATRKLVDYEACCEEMDDDHGYLCLSDSDDGCYSDDVDDFQEFLLDDDDCFYDDYDSDMSF